jgi:uncharacterized protein YuzB (UPF0349 family)
VNFSVLFPVKASKFTLSLMILRATLANCTPAKPIPAGPYVSWNFTGLVAAVEGLSSGHYSGAIKRCKCAAEDGMAQCSVRTQMLLLAEHSCWRQQLQYACLTPASICMTHTCFNMHDSHLLQYACLTPASICMTHTCFNMHDSHLHQYA